MRLVFAWIMLVIWVLTWIVHVFKVSQSGKEPIDNYVIMVETVFIVLACLAIAFP